LLCDNSEDCDVVSLLLCLGRVSSMQTNKHLLYQAYHAGRIDILLKIIQFVADLSERDALKCIILCISIEESALVSVLR
jgi:hypothetical protein